MFLSDQIMWQSSDVLGTALTCLVQRKIQHACRCFTIAKTSISNLRNRQNMSSFEMSCILNIDQHNQSISVLLQPSVPVFIWYQNYQNILFWKKYVCIRISRFTSWPFKLKSLKLGVSWLYILKRKTCVITPRNNKNIP